MKTKPKAHQELGLKRLAENPEWFLLASEQGTGKTWMLLADAERQFAEGRIDALLVVAPNGVHTNWVRREIPAHLGVPWVAARFRTGAGKRETASWERVFAEDDSDSERKLKVLAINIDAIKFPRGRALAERFLARWRTMMVVDESARIKSIDAAQTRWAIWLGERAVSRRAASGTPITNSPIDLFAQFEFLAPDRGALGTRSYRAFVAEYAQLLPKSHPTVKKLIEDHRRRTNGRYEIDPQLIKRDAEGRPMWRNLERLSALLAPHTFRVTKAECLDLPPKIYQSVFFELSPRARAAYRQLEEDLRFEHDDGDVDIFTSLTSITKLRQVTSGFLLRPGEAEPVTIDDEATLAARLGAFEEALSGVDGQFIVWACFREEIARVCARLRAAGVSFVEYHGGVRERDREDAIDAFQSGAARAFVGNPASCAEGLTLTAARTAIYYSTDYSIYNRQQSEDRCHRIGTTSPVVYVDLVAEDTIDERIASALAAKAEVAERVLGGI